MRLPPGARAWHLLPPPHSPTAAALAALHARPYANKPRGPLRLTLGANPTLSVSRRQSKRLHTYRHIAITQGALRLTPRPCANK
eukprot:365467-Chlamydomonas_euryale.AAC.3